MATRILIQQKKCWVIVLTNRLDKIFQNLKAKNEKALITFSVSGYPNEETGLEICKAISDSGAHIHELNIAHEEAQADGPVWAGTRSTKPADEEEEPHKPQVLRQ